MKIQFFADFCESKWQKNSPCHRIGWQPLSLASNRKEFFVGCPRYLKSHLKSSRPGHSCDILVGSNLTAVTTASVDVKRVKCRESECFVEFRAVADRRAHLQVIYVKRFFFAKKGTTFQCESFRRKFSGKLSIKLAKGFSGDSLERLERKRRKTAKVQC